MTEHRQISSAQSVEPLVGNYFISAYPPFSCWQSSQTEAVEHVLDTPAPDQPIGLYVHIPFCGKKCDYCYYLSYVARESGTVEAYLAAVVDELSLYADRFPALQERRVSFVYFGGGTPSTLTPPQIRSVGLGLRNSLCWPDVEEITFEVAPRSVRRKKLKALQEIGVNRISMGVQSFDDRLLQLNGRYHFSTDVTRAYDLIQEFDFDWVNLDLMVGLLGETWKIWKASIQRVIDLDPDSVTIYQTEIPPNTKLYRDLKEGNLAATPVPWELKRERLDYAFNELEQGGYTVASGYSAVKDPSRHRFRYQQYLWRGGDMLGLGVGSFSYLGGVHFQNTGKLDDYQELIQSGKVPIRRALQLTNRERLVREFILQLKCGEIQANSFQAKFGVDVLREFSQPIAELETEGWLTVSKAGIRLTRPGLLKVDRLLPRFYQQEYRRVKYW